jgi:hypothetical protein
MAAVLVAFYDANVLYPAELRNFLMYLATTGLFRAKWSNAVHEEWVSNLLKNRPDLTREKLERTRQLMDPEAAEIGWSWSKLRAKTEVCSDCLEQQYLLGPILETRPKSRSTSTLALSSGGRWLMLLNDQGIPIRRPHS